jgi:cellulose synthase/poly-beta-1,6-N-acetylglucosamine synthase-like glycosyltransferase
MASLWLVLPGLIIWLSILVLPWRSWSTRESLDADPGLSLSGLSSVSVLIPARNDEDVITRTLTSLTRQG